MIKALYFLYLNAWRRNTEEELLFGFLFFMIGEIVNWIFITAIVVVNAMDVLPHFVRGVILYIPVLFFNSRKINLMRYSYEHFYVFKNPMAIKLLYEILLCFLSVSTVFLMVLCCSFGILSNIFFFFSVGIVIFPAIFSVAKEIFYRRFSYVGN